MIISPMIRNNICLNAHPTGCVKEVENQIDYVKALNIKRGRQPGAGVAGGTHAQGIKAPVRAVLVVGCSTGYGLASRITASFGYGAATIGVSFENEGTKTKGGTPGWYNNLAFDKIAQEAGIPTFTINGDAFSDEVRAQVIENAKKMGLTFDLVVYSLASPVRTDPDTGYLYRSVLKPFEKPYSGNTIDVMSGILSEKTIEVATDDEAAQTVKVMGGEDWQRWITQLSEAGVLAHGCTTVAYSYIGPELSHPLYREGTIGQAKKHLEATARTMNETLSRTINGSAYVSVNKGLVTRSSAVIPVIPLYLAVLFKIMKDKGTHEGCIEQIERLYAERLYSGTSVPLDDNNLIRIDDYEMDNDVQRAVTENLAQLTQENLYELADLEGYRHDFLVTGGFDVSGIDYEKDIPLDTIGA